MKVQFIIINNKAYIFLSINKARFIKNQRLCKENNVKSINWTVDVTK